MRNILKINEFHKKTIDDLLTSRRKSKNTSSVTNETKVYKTVTYMPGLVWEICEVRHLWQSKIHLEQKAVNTFNHLFSMSKSKINNEDRSNLIYQIECKGD